MTESYQPEPLQYVYIEPPAVPVAPAPAARKRRWLLPTLVVLTVGAIGYALPHDHTTSTATTPAAVVAAPAPANNSAQLAACQRTVNNYIDELTTWGDIAKHYIQALTYTKDLDFTDAVPEVQAATDGIDRNIAGLKSSLADHVLCLDGS